MSDMRRGFSTNHVPWIVVVLAAVVATGCDGSRGVVPVAGTIRFAGQPPPAAGYVFFVPMDGGAENGDAESRPRSGSALFMQDGSFSVTTFAPNDGLRPGRYEARVECTLPGGPVQGEGAGRSAVPVGFAPPAIEVPAGGPRPFKVEIDVR
jgi:hypothetical protein